MVPQHGVDPRPHRKSNPAESRPSPRLQVKAKAPLRHPPGPLQPDLPETDRRLDPNKGGVESIQGIFWMYPKELLDVSSILTFFPTTGSKTFICCSRLLKMRIRANLDLDPDLAYLLGPGQGSVSLRADCRFYSPASLLSNWSFSGKKQIMLAAR